MAGRANIVAAVLVVGAIALGALGFAGFGEDTANGLLFAAWSLALLALFALALRLPLRDTRHDDRQKNNIVDPENDFQRGQGQQCGPGFRANQQFDHAPNDLASRIAASLPTI